LDKEKKDKFSKVILLNSIFNQVSSVPLPYPYKMIQTYGKFRERKQYCWRNIEAVSNLCKLYGDNKAYDINIVVTLIQYFWLKIFYIAFWNYGVAKTLMSSKCATLSLICDTSRKVAYDSNVFLFALFTAQIKDKMNSPPVQGGHLHINQVLEWV